MNGYTLALQGKGVLRYNERIIKIFREFGCQLVLWNIYPNDTLYPPTAYIERLVIKNLRNESIILLHDGIESSLGALPNIIDRVKGKGYKFVTVSELLDIKKGR